MAIQKEIKIKGVLVDYHNIKEIILDSNSVRAIVNSYTDKETRDENELDYISDRKIVVKLSEEEGNEIYGIIYNAIKKDAFEDAIDC